MTSYSMPSGGLGGLGGFGQQPYDTGAVGVQTPPSNPWGGGGNGFNATSTYQNGFDPSQANAVSSDPQQLLRAMSDPKPGQTLPDQFNIQPGAFNRFMPQPGPGPGFGANPFAQPGPAQHASDSQIGAMYQQLLGRLPEQDGYKYWGQYNPADVFAGIQNSAEYKTGHPQAPAMPPAPQRGHRPMPTQPPQMPRQFAPQQQQTLASLFGGLFGGGFGGSYTPQRPSAPVQRQPGAQLVQGPDGSYWRNADGSIVLNNGPSGGPLTY